VAKLVAAAFYINHVVYPAYASIDFDDYTISSYGTYTSTDGGATHTDPTSATVLDDGRTLKISGNAWKKISLPTTIASNTCLIFDFKAENVEEIHAIGFDADNTHENQRRLFTMGGSQVGDLSNTQYIKDFTS
jgi:hypothetical protein